MRVRQRVWAASASVLALCLSGASALAQEAQSGPVAPPPEDELVVTGIRASQQQSIDTKRRADAVMDVLSAEDVGKFPDKNVAEALQRVPGVQINREFGEGERVSVRGLAPNLTRTLLNGHGLATADWFILEQQTATRSFNFLMLPSEIIGQVQVYKSPTADLEEGGVGGTVDVITRKPLDLAHITIQGSAQAAYTEMSDKFDPQGSALLSWKNDAETLGVMLAGVYEKRRIRRDGVEVLGYFDNDPTAGTQLVPSLIGSALFQQERVRKGVNFDIQYRPDDRLEVNLSGLYSRFNADNYNENYLAWGSNALGGGGALTNVTMNGDTAVAGTITSTANGRGVVYDAADRLAHAQTRNIDFDAVYRPTPDWELHAKIGYTDAEGNTDSQPFAEFGAPASFTYDLRGDTPAVHFSGVDPTKPGDMQFDFASLHQITNDDKEFYAYFDAERKFEGMGPLTAIRVGGKYTSHRRDADFEATTYGSFFLPLLANGCGGGPCGAGDFAGGLTPDDYLDRISDSGTLTSYWQVDRNKLESIFFGLPASAQARVPNYPEVFGVGEKAFAGYALAKLGGDRWRGNAGVRVVSTKQTSDGYISGVPAGAGTVSNAFGVFAPISVDRTYTDILPSLNFSFDLTSDVVFRLSAARVMARPDFTDVAPRISLNPGSLSGTGGNPNIDPYRANQFDVSLEWYPTRDSIFSADFYYKDINSFITDSPSTEVFGIETQTPNLSLCTSANNTTNPNLYNCQFVINRRSNGGGGRVQGVELQAQKRIWSGFGVQANYTYSDAKTNSGDPLPGNSKNTYNLTGYFENERFSARLSYNYRSDFFVTFDRSTQLNQKALASLDASVNVNVTRNVAVTFDAVNLTDEKIEQYATDTFRPRAIYDNGRIFYGGVRFKF